MMQKDATFRKLIFDQWAVNKAAAVDGPPLAAN